MYGDALVLAAGLGTRLRPLTDVRAKAAVPVAGEPLIRRIAAWLARHDIRKLVVNLHHLPHTVTSILGDGQDLGARVRYSWEQPRVLGSAGGPRLALPLLAADTFFIVNGDTLTSMNPIHIAEDHASTGARVTLGVVANREHDRYGGVLVDDEGRVAGFVPRGPGARGSWHFIGVHVADASVFRDLTPGVPASSIGGLYDRLISSDPGAVRAYRCDAEFWDIGTVNDYWRTSMAFDGEGRTRGGHLTAGATADVTRSIMWDDVQIGRGARIDECILTDHVRVPEGVEYRRKILVQRDADRVDATPLEIQE